MDRRGLPIFYDPAGRRWRRVRSLWYFGAVLLSVIAGVFIASVIINPFLPDLNLNPIPALPKPEDARLQSPQSPPSIIDLKTHQAVGELKEARKHTRVVPARRPSQMKVAPAPQATPPARELATQTKPLSIGFYVNWDDSSYASLKRNLPDLDWVIPEWVRLQDGTTPITVDLDPRALDLIHRDKPQTLILPLVQNYENETWNSDLLARSIATATARTQLVNALSQLVQQNKFAGVCIDLEEVPTASQQNLLAFMQELRRGFASNGWIVVQAVPFDNPDWNYSAYAAATDFLMLMAYDQHWEASEPGPIAAADWFQKVLDQRMHQLDPGKTIISIGNYGYDWTSGQKEAEEMTFQEAVLAARDSSAEISFDDVRRNPHFDYEEEDGSQHTVWFLDAISAYDEMKASLQFGPAGFALWRLGSEDPSLWSVFGSSHNVAANGADSIAGLSRIKYGYDIDFEGSGEILQVAAEPQDGARDISLGADGQQITSEKYTAIPSSYVIRRSGDHPGEIALTFDDGPDPEWTPQILDILKQQNVPATFFVIGQNGQAHPDLLRREVAEGHEIGNHTFFHPNLGEIPAALTDLELNACQRLIESVTGRSTTLFRPPYFGDAEPTTPDEVEPIVRAKRLHYITVGLRIDPEDWERPGAGQILQATLKGALDTDPDTRGEVVLLHDAGGDRSETVEALPLIIANLRARGFRFVTVSQLAGLTRDQAMPPVTQKRGVFAGADVVTFYGLSLLGWGIHWLFLIGIVLGVARILFIGSLALAQWWRARKRIEEHSGESYEPFVSIIVPAYNEGRVIGLTIESLLQSNYPAFEVIVVDDGSPDNTSALVEEEFGDHPRVRLLKKENGGKAEALNLGLRHARGEVVVALDADTLFTPNTVAALAHRFHDPNMGAVAGNAKVGNRVNIVTRWQALEYVTSQNLDRRAFASLNCITVVPGAVGAWRRGLLEQVGGFSPDTLAEDQDLTLKVRRLNYKIGYSERAVAWTEAPDTLRGLAKQRFRWSYGTLQCMWKHRSALFRPRYGALGFVAMPNVWIFQILFPLISPAMDLMLAWTLLSAALAHYEHGSGYTVSSLPNVLFFYAFFLAVDWISAFVAFALEKGERRSLLWWLFLQRFSYRQVMYYVMIKSVRTAARGAIVGWGKLERKATAAARH